MDNKPTILKSTRLARAKGVNTLLFLKTATVNLVLGVCELVLNTRYFIRQTDGTNVLPALEADVKTTEMGRTVIFSPITTGAGGGGTVPFSGAGAPSASTLAAGSYVAGPVPSLYVDMTAKALYVCTTAGTEATSVWVQISGGSGGGNLTELTFVSDGGDYIICNPGLIRVLKPYKLRTSLVSETIRGITHNYIYTPSPSSGTVLYYTRSDSYSGVTESQIIIPDYVVGNLIYASPLASAAASSWVALQSAVPVAGTTVGIPTIGMALYSSGTPGTTAAQFNVSSILNGQITGLTLVNGGVIAGIPTNPIPLANILSGGTVGCNANVVWGGPMIDVNADGRAWATQ